PLFIHPISKAPKAELRVIQHRTPTVVAGITTVVTGHRTVVQTLVVRNDAATFTAGHILIHLETEDGHVAKGANFFPIDTAAVALCAVFQQKKIPFLSYFLDGLDICRRPAHMNSDNPRRARRDLRLY